MNIPRRIAIASIAIAAVLPSAALAQAKPAACRMKDNTVTVLMTTSMGPITLLLDAKKAPASADNFVKYVEAGFYNGTVFHRVIDGFMIQGGGFSKDLVQKPTNAPIKNEGANGLKNEPYTIAMARTNMPDSATSQFFINVGENVMLDAVPPKPGYAVFGKVIDGKETVDKIRKVAVARTSVSEAQPLSPVVLEKVECL